MPTTGPHAGPSTIMEETVPRRSNSTVRNRRKETRRTLGEIACAECRRLKIKCDRLVPCTTCVKRGCAPLCPNETIPPGEGARYVNSAEDHLRRRMAKLEERMHSLEDALAIIQTTQSIQPHPLLVKPFKSEDKTITTTRDEVADLADSLGTLYVAEQSDGDHRFYGPTGGSESLLFEAKEHVPPPLQWQTNGHDRSLQDEIPQEIMLFYESFPVTHPTIPPEPVQTLIESFLPPKPRASALCETFLEHLMWMTQIVSRQHVIAELMPAVYRQPRGGIRGYGPHDLGLLLMVFAIGALLDLTLPPYNVEARRYYLLGRAALALQPAMTKHSLVTAKALHLMSIYNGMSGEEKNLEHTYILLTLSCQIALRIGLHMDPSFWGINGRQAYERRAYFWNLLAGDLWQSMVTGRPPVIRPPFIRCDIPTQHDEEIYQQGEVPLGFGVWSFHFVRECAIPVFHAVLSAKPPSYERVMELDSQIREFEIPKSDSSHDPQRTATAMRIFVRRHFHELILMYLHRGFFAQAITDCPENPLKSTYSRSFLAAYRAACVVLESTVEQFAAQPLLCTRIWRIWSFSFSASVIIGAVVTQCPGIQLDPCPLEQFERACRLFQDASTSSSRAARALPVLFRMREKLVQSKTTFRAVVPSIETIDVRVKQEEKDDEIDIFRGKTRLVVPKRPPTAPATSAVDYRPSISPSSHLRQNGQMPMAWQETMSYEAVLEAPTLEEMEDVMMRRGGFPLGWDSLDREISRETGEYVGGFDAVHPIATSNSFGGEVMLDDKWSSFMQSGVYNDLPLSNT